MLFNLCLIQILFALCSLTIYALCLVWVLTIAGGTFESDLVYVYSMRNNHTAFCFFVCCLFKVPTTIGSAGRTFTYLLERRVKLQDVERMLKESWTELKESPPKNFHPTYLLQRGVKLQYVRGILKESWT